MSTDWIDANPRTPDFGSELYQAMIELQIIRPAKSIDLQMTVELATRLVTHLHLGRRNDPVSLLSQFESIEQSLELELSQKRFASIRPPNGKYFEQKKLFGPE